MKASPSFPFTKQIPRDWGSSKVCILCLLVFLGGIRREPLRFESTIGKMYEQSGQAEYTQWVAFMDADEDKGIDKLMEVGRSMLSEPYWKSRWMTDGKSKD